MKLEQLLPDEQARIKELCQKLFHQSYILEFVFSPGEGIKKANGDYTFLYKHFEEVAELLDASGWRLCRDDAAGVIYLTSDFPGAHMNLNKMESMFLLALRLLYDERQRQATGTAEVLCTVRDIVERLNTLSALDQSSKQERAAALRTLAGRNLICRISGSWTEIDTRFVVLPSVLCALSAEKLARVRDLLASAQSDLNAPENEDAGETSDEAADETRADETEEGTAE